MTAISTAPPARETSGVRHLLSALAPFACILAVAAVLPFVSNDYWALIGTRAAIYWVLVSGLNLIVGFAGHLAIGYVALLTLGAYTASVLVAGNVLPPVPVFAALPIAGVVGAVLGVIGGIAGFSGGELMLAFFANGALLNFYGFVPVALGGLGNNRGAIFGGLALGLFQQAANFLVGGIFSSVAVFTLFIVVLLAAPQGLFGTSAARRV